MEGQRLLQRAIEAACAALSPLARAARLDDGLGAGGRCGPTCSRRRSGKGPAHLPGATSASTKAPMIIGSPESDFTQPNRSHLWPSLPPLSDRLLGLVVVGRAMLSGGVVSYPSNLTQPNCC